MEKTTERSTQKETCRDCGEPATVEIFRNNDNNESYGHFCEHCSEAAAVTERLWSLEGKIKMRYETKILSGEKIVVTEVSYHKNGVHGESFFAVLFHYKSPRPGHQYLGIVFDSDEKLGLRTAVINLDLVPIHGIGHNNKYRGDVFHEALKRAIKSSGL